MAMWTPDGFQDVLAAPDEKASVVLQVDGNWDIDVIEELAPAPGQPGTQWLKVRARSPDGLDNEEGFMQRAWLAIPEVERDAFAQACLGAAQEVGTDAQFLFAFADMLTQVANPAGNTGTVSGPFLLSEDTWKQALDSDPDLGLTTFDRFRPYLQPQVAARITAEAVRKNPSISNTELSLALLFGPQQAEKLMVAPADTAFDEALAKVFENQTQARAAEQKVKDNTADLFKDPVTDKTRTVGEVLKGLSDKLDPVLKEAEETFGPESEDETDNAPPDVPGSAELDLNANEVYRSDLLFAADRTKFAASALAALIDAEAAKGKNGLWNPLSDAFPHSTAFGLTQFLEDTWVGEAKRAGTFLNQVGTARGFVSGVSVADRTALLALRKDPRQSITAGAEYATFNLDQLARSGITTKTLVETGFAAKEDEDSLRAKLAYLAHHEGLAGAKAILTNKLDPARAQKLLKANTGKRAPQLLAAAGGSAVRAYTTWLKGYIAAHIVPEKFQAKGAADKGRPDDAPKTAPKKPIVVTKPAQAPADATGTFILTEAHLVGLWARSAFPIDPDRITVFGIRGCLPVDQAGNGVLVSEHAVKFVPVTYETMRCTIGHWLPGKGIALFPGSTVPSGQTVRKLVKASGNGVNQLSPGRYPRFEAGFHKRKQGAAGHWALLQGCALAVQRTADNANFDLADRWQIDEAMGDNIHCAFGLGRPPNEPSNAGYNSAGCQTIAGLVTGGRPPGTAQGPFAKFIIPFLPGKQKTAEYVLFPGNELQQMIRDQFRGQRIVLRMGSQGDAVKLLQRKLGLQDDGGFGAGTLKALIAFQGKKFGNDENGLVGPKTAAALGLDLPFFDFDDAIKGGSGQSKTAPN